MACYFRQCPSSSVFEIQFFPKLDLFLQSAVMDERYIVGWVHYKESSHLTSYVWWGWSWVLHGKLPVTQLPKNFPVFYGTQRFITMFTRDLHWSLSWARWIQSVPPYAISLRSILILSTHLLLGLPHGLFPSSFPTKILYAFLVSNHMCYMPCSSHCPWLDHSTYVWWRVQVMKPLIVQFFQASYHFIPVWSMLSPHILFSDTFSLCSSFNVRDQVSHPYRTTGSDENDMINK
jgi:hypothetical protein